MASHILIKDTIWNIMLAVIPVMLAYVLLWVSKLKAGSILNTILVAITAILWLAFLPNTCYLLTEWRHFFAAMDTYNIFLRANYDAFAFVQLSLMWLFYLIYSCVGMLCFTLAIRPIEQHCTKSGSATSFWILPLNIILSLGVYLGLVLRFNSWDLVTRPHTIWAAIQEIGRHPRLGLFICAFGLFLWVSYLVIDIWIDGLNYRLHKKKS